MSIRRHQYQMDMVGHQAVRQYANLVTIRVFAQMREVLTIIGAREKDLNAPIRPLGNMVRNAGKYVTGTAWHTSTLVQRQAAR